MYPMFSWGFYILVNMALLLGATPLLDYIPSFKEAWLQMEHVITAYNLS